jgi:hypothetical protein
LAEFDCKSVVVGFKSCQETWAVGASGQLCLRESTLGIDWPDPCTSQRAAEFDCTGSRMHGLWLDVADTACTSHSPRPHSAASKTSKDVKLLASTPDPAQSFCQTRRHQSIGLPYLFQTPASGCFVDYLRKPWFVIYFLYFSRPALWFRVRGSLFELLLFSAPHEVLYKILRTVWTCAI